MSAAGRPGRDSRAIARSPAIAAIAAVALSGCSMSQARGPTPHANVARHLPATASRTPCFAHPGACGFPDPRAGNVGPTKPCAALRPSGSITITSTGERVHDRSVRGTITVEAPDVRIENVCVVDAAAGNINNGPAVRFGAAGGVIARSKVQGANATDQSVEQAVASDNNNVTAEYDYFANCGECIHDSGWTVTNSYVLANGGPYSEGYSGLTPHGELDHREDLYCNDGSATLRHDTLVNSFGTVATVFCDTGDGAGGPCVNHVTMTENLLIGGGYVLYACGNSNSPGTSTMDIEHNRFARCTREPVRQTSDGGWECSVSGGHGGGSGSGADAHGLWPYGGHYGVDADTFCPPTPGQTWAGNVWDNNRAPVRCQHG